MDIEWKLAHTQCKDIVSQIQIAQDIQLPCHLQDVVWVSFVAFECCTWCEVTCPEAVWVVSIREEVIALRCPCTIGFVQRIEVTRRCGIEHVHTTTTRLLDCGRNTWWGVLERDGRWSYLSIDVFDQFVEVLEPFVGIFVLKVTAHGHDDVIGSETGSLKRLNQRSRVLRNQRTQKSIV